MRHIIGCYSCVELLQFNGEMFVQKRWLKRIQCNHINKSKYKMSLESVPNISGIGLILYLIWLLDNQINHIKIHKINRYSDLATPHHQYAITIICHHDIVNLSFA